MPSMEPHADPAIMNGFLTLCGKRNWSRRLSEIGAGTRSRSLGARALQRRHALELALAKLCDPQAKCGPAERRVLLFARDAVRLAQELPQPSRDRLRELLLAGLTGDANLVPLFHVLRVAALQRSRGFEVRYAGLTEDAPYDLLITREGVSAEVACETVSAEEGRHMHRGDWCALVDRVNPDLQTWLSAHPGRYVLKMTLPEGLREPSQIAELHRRISALLSDRKRQDVDAAAVLKLDPLLLAGAQASLPGTLRAQFGPEAHLAVASDPAGGSVFVLAARAGQENDISAAVCRRLALSAGARLSGDRPGILAVFLEDIDREEWRGLRERLELEGAVRRFLTHAEARRVVAVSCTSRVEMFEQSPPDAAPDGELRFRNPAHPQAKLAALLPAIASSN